MSKIKVGLVFGGRSVEHEVSIISAHQIIENIDREKYQIVPIYIDKDGQWFTGDELLHLENFKEKSFKNLKKIILSPATGDANLYLHPSEMGLFSKKVVDRVDVFFPVIHGTNGEDGTLQGLFELMDFPYVGPGVVGSAAGMDKVIMKEVFASNNLPLLPYLWFYRKEWEEDKDKIIDRVKGELSLPVFVKPANLGSSIGISKAKTEDELINAVELAANYDLKIIVEKAVVNPREINCSVLGYHNHLEVSVCEEPLGWQEFLSYQDKYMTKGTSSKGMAGAKRRIPADISPELTEQIQAMARTAFRSLDARGVARIDFLIDNNEQIYVNEINTLPGSFAFYLWEPMGKKFKKLLDDIIQIAIKIHREKTKNIYSYDVDLLSQFGEQGTKQPGGSKQ